MYDIVLSWVMRSRQSMFTEARIVDAMKDDDCRAGLSVMTMWN
jgi:hypothetical protein